MQVQPYLFFDGRCEEAVEFYRGALDAEVIASSDAEADRLFSALAEGGQVQMPLGKTFFSSRFGMVADRFGVSWMVYTAS